MQLSRGGGCRRFLAPGLIGTLFLGVFSFHLPLGVSLTSILPPDTAQAEEQSSIRGELMVFAAASLTEPFTEIGKRLELSHSGLKVVYNFGGSQMLRTQIELGAHADVFASADAVQMEQAKKNGVVQGESPIFVRNRLAVIVPQANPGQVKEFHDLAKPGLKLDLANANVPVGNYSRQALRKASTDYGVDFERQALANIVSEEDNVKQVVTKVQLGEADAGIVYVSDVTPAVSKDVQIVPIPDAYNQIAAYPIALTKETKNSSAAKAFIAFVLSAEGQAILKAHHFAPIDATEYGFHVMAIHFCMLRLRCCRSYAQHEREYAVHPMRSGAKSKGQPMENNHQARCARLLLPGELRKNGA